MRTTVIEACWALVVVVWIGGAIYGSRRSPPASRRASGEGSGWRVALFILAVLLLHFAKRDLQGLSTGSWWVALPGLAVLLAATAFTIWARVSLGLMWSMSPDTLQQDHRLRTSGPYAVTRHPIYTGLLGMLLGTTLLDGFGASLVVFVVGAIFCAIRIPVEERLMTATFPEEYPLYRQHVPRLVPGLKRRRQPKATTL